MLVVRYFRNYVEPDALNRNSIVPTTEPVTPIKGTSSAPTDSVTTSTPSQAAATSSAAALHPATAALLGLGGPKQQKVVTDDQADEENVNNEENEAENEKFLREKRNPADVLKELPITPGALTNNLGIPIIVVVNKVSY